MKPTDILFEDNHLLVVNKPPNIPVQEDASGDTDLFNQLKDYIKIKYNKPGNVFLGLVHRLDRPARGVMVFARTSKAASRLSDQFRKGTVEKEYLIITQGKLEKKSGKLIDYLYKDRNKNVVSVVDSTFEGGKKAILEYEVINRLKELNLVKVRLETGRSHQIRVQFQNAGTPLWGDQKYNPEATVGEQLALMSNRLKIEHPTSKEQLSFSCPYPDEYPWDVFKFKD